MKKLYGTGVALVTPFTENLEVDYKSLRRLLIHTAKGADYRNFYHWAFRVRDGRICAVKEYVDTLYAQRTLFA